MCQLTARALRLWRAGIMLGQPPVRVRRPPRSTRDRAAHQHIPAAERPRHRIFMLQSAAVQRDWRVATPRFLVDLGGTSTAAVGGTGLGMCR